MTERTAISDAAAPAALPAVSPVDITVSGAPPSPTATGEKPTGGRMRIEAVPATGVPGGPERPTWLPEKFKSPEDLAHAYAQLEQRLGHVGHMPAPAAPAAPVAPGQAPAAPAQPAAPADLQARLTQEYASTGQVSPALRQEFARSTGLAEQFIDQHIAYLKHQGSTAQSMAEERLGGKAAVAELTEWAKSSLSPDERAAFNRLVYSGDDAAARLAVDGLAAKYEAQVGRSPKIIAGRRPQGDYGGIVPFQSEAELRAAQRDPRYREDPAYREQVQDRLNVAMRLGLIR